MALLVALASKILTRFGDWLCQPPFGLKTIFALGSVTAWLLLTAGLSILPWSFTFMWISAFSDFKTAFYFASVTFTTLGYGDIVLPIETRLLSGLCAANGLLVFGLFTAFLVEFIRRLREAQRHAIAVRK
jgi:hypothetical protein